MVIVIQRVENALIAVAILVATIAVGQPWWVLGPIGRAARAAGTRPASRRRTFVAVGIGGAAVS